MAFDDGLQAIAVFGFFAIVVWLRNRKELQMAADRHELYRNMLSQPGGSVEAVRDLMRHDNERLAQKDIDDARSTGLILVAVSLGLAMFLFSVTSSGKPVYLVGAIPGLVGVAQLVHAAILARRQRARGRAPS